MKPNRKILLLFLSLIFTLLAWLAFSRWQKTVLYPPPADSFALQPLESEVDSEIIAIIKKRRGMIAD